MEVIHEINATTTAEVNKQTFIDDYGVQFEIPSLYVQDAKFFKGQPEYAVYLTNYVAPRGKMQLQRHGKVNETVNIREILELDHVQKEHSKTKAGDSILNDERPGGGAVLRLVRVKDQQ